MSAEGGAGQPLVTVGVGAVFAFELVTSAGGDLLIVKNKGDVVAAQPGGGGDQRLGQGGAVPGSLHEDGAAGAGLDAELVLWPRAAAEARTRAPVPPGSWPGRVRARPIARFGCAGGAPGGRAVVAMVASSARASLRSGLPLSSSRSRWSPSRTYQPPPGSLAHRPVRLDGPRENSGTGVASRPVPPSKAAR